MNVNEPWELSISPGSHTVTRHTCSYCEGWDGPPEFQKPEGNMFHYNHSAFPELDRKICERCWTKVFDTVLGEPKK